MSDTAHIKSRRLVRRFSAPLMMPALVVCLVACLTACSGNSSDESDDETAASSEESQGEPVADTDDAVAEPAPAETFDPDALVRRLDRLTAGTDAHVLRSGLAEEAAPASWSLDALETRFQSVQSRLQEMRSSTPAEGVSR